MIMEYCEMDLALYLKKYKLDEGKAIEIIKQVLTGLNYLVGKGVIHRDIKPANILRVGNRWKLSDFGFAARARFGFKDRINVGTPLYMAP